METWEEQEYYPQEEQEYVAEYTAENITEHDDSEAEQDGGEAGAGEEESEAEAQEEVEYKADYKQLQEFSTGLSTQGFNKGIQRATKTPQERALIEVKMTLDMRIYSNISEYKKKDIINYLERLNNLELYNIETVILATLWKLSKNELDKKNFSSFTKQYDNVNPIDLLRYIRKLE